MKKCTQCGTEYPEEAQVCARDQAPLQLVGPPVPNPEPKEIKPLTLVLMIVGAVGLLLGGRYVYEYQVIRPRVLASEEIACRGNLKQIELRKGLWEVEHNKKESDTPTEADLFGSGPGQERPPKCPGGGVYQLRSLGDAPTCSVHSRL